jgi:outer membrane protein assembly factor BamB
MRRCVWHQPWPNGKVFVGSDDGYAYCLDAASGKLVWKLRAGPHDERILARGRMISRWPVRTGMLVDDGIAYFGAGVFPHEKVFIYAVEAATGKSRLEE